MKKQLKLIKQLDDFLTKSGFRNLFTVCTNNKAPVIDFSRLSFDNGRLLDTYCFVVRRVGDSYVISVKSASHD